MMPSLLELQLPRPPSCKGNYREIFTRGSVLCWRYRDGHPRSSASEHGGRPIDPPDLRAGSRILDHLSDLDVHRQLTRPVTEGDLLVGWVSQSDASEPVQPQPTAEVR